MQARATALGVPALRFEALEAQASHAYASPTIELTSQASFEIPIGTWREAVDAAFPETCWIRFRRSTLTKLPAYRSRQGHADWDATFDALLTKADG